MRLSVDRRDAGFSEEAIGAEAYLDGERVSDRCVTADEELGYVVLYRRDDNGENYLDPVHRDMAAIEIRYGDVRVVPAPGSHPRHPGRPIKASGFSNADARLRPTRNGDAWVTTRELRYRMDRSRWFDLFHNPGDFVDEVVVPVEFRTNLASVPRPLWWLIPPFGRHTAASVVHDWLYASREHDRLTSDRVFRMALTDSGVRRRRVVAMYWGVRLFGWLAWHRPGIAHHRRK